MIALFAVGLELGGSDSPAAPRPDLSGMAHPAVVLAPAGRAPATGAPAVVDEDRSQEALMLVHQWSLPGDQQALLERLGGGIEPPGSRPTWTVERVSETVYRVFYRAALDAPAYAFDADLDSRMVWPTPETQELLVPRLASLRSVR